MWTFHLPPPAKKQRTSFTTFPVHGSIHLPWRNQCDLPSAITPFAPINPNVPQVLGQFPASTFTPRLTDIFACTPFGIYCRVCKDHVGSSERMLKSHFDSRHGSVSVDAVKAFKIIAEKEVDQLSRSGDIEQFLLGSLKGYGCKCGAVFGEKKSLNRHCKEVKSCQFESKDAQSVLLFKTLCGRLVSQEIVQQLTSSTPMGKHLDFESTEAVLSKYIRADESVGAYTAMFYPLLESSSTKNFDAVLNDMVDWWSKPAEDTELGLKNLLSAADEWINTARRQVEMVPGNLRSALQVFGGQELGEISQNLLYTFRHKESLVLPEIKRLLSFVWRHPSELLSSFKQSIYFADPMLLPLVFHKLLLEEVLAFDSHPVVVQYCLARCFKKKANQIEMPQCGDIASIVANVLSILRAGICSYMVSSQMSDQQARDLVDATRSSRVLNIISPMIRRLREMQRRKPKRRKLTVSPEGDIAVDGFEFRHDQWSKLIPTVSQVCCDLLGLLFESKDWSLFLNETTPISVSQSQNGEFNFSILIGGKKVESTQLLFKKSVDHNLVFDHLSSYVEIAFHGFGGGSMRFEELRKLTLWHAIWHRGTLYYCGESIKKYSFRSRPSLNKAEHKLPTGMARVYLLFHLVARKLDNNSLIPVQSKCTHSMTDAVAEVFNFSERPDATQVRQLWASICNVIFPKGQTAIISATGDVAEMSGHSAATHEVRYGSELIGGIELNYRKYHNAIGAMNGISASGSQIHAGNLLMALKTIYGPDADYTSNLQRDMVVLASTPSDRHSHVGLPCGSGKSLAWILPLAAAAMSSKKIGMMIVVLPYNFLVCHLELSARKILQDQFDVTIVSLTTKECSEQCLPDKLANDEHLPDLVFIGLDAFASLQQKHLASLSQWAASGRIHRIFIDEVHTLYGETFRDAYEQFPDIAHFGVPIMTLSGTIPYTLIGPLSFYLNMSEKKGNSDFDVVFGNDLLGSFPHGFKISCGLFTHVEETAVQRAKCILSNKPQFGLHVICSGKKKATHIFTALSAKYKTELVTSDIPRERQAEIAAKWSHGEFDVLISTTSALVGNESSHCQAVFIVGYLFNLMSAVQAMGRLRPRQRKSTGCIEIFLDKLSEKQMEKCKQRDETRCNVLIEKGLLTHQHVEPFQAIGTVAGLHHWATTDSGCRIIALSKRFGLQGVAECKACDRCHGTPVARTAAVATSKANVKVILENKALQVLKRLEIMCLACGQSSCNGEHCIGRNKCFRCGAQHLSKYCKVDFRSLLENHGCFYCLDLYGRRGYQAHGYNQCPLQRRLRRLLIKGWQNDTSQVDFMKHVTKILCDKEKFYKFIAKYGDCVM